MGGRGTNAPAVRRVSASEQALLDRQQEIERSYEIISRESLTGQATYAFLESCGRNWSVLTKDVTDSSPYDPRDTFGLVQPTLRWINGNNIIDVFVDGMNTEDFLAATGLELDMRKGGFVLSKRMSRILRPQYATGFFDASEVDVHYMDLSDSDLKVWDGAGLVSRDMMTRMIENLPDVPDVKKAQLVRELRHGQRVEFTLMTASGQDKGHGVVSDSIDHDFVLPRDTKGEIKLVNGQTFVGINFVHGRNGMRLDIQSLINLYPFFEHEQLAGWLAEEGQLFTQSIETGSVAEAMSRVDRHTTLEDVQSWGMREYFASGGDPMWFQSHVKSLSNQHLERLNHSTLGKMRLPIPGGRHYVMPEAVGQAAGLGIEVGRGEIFVDPKRGTAWVNDQDWLKMEDGKEGIAGILGGADHDDALWLHNFTDHDGERKVLAWRSPNQAGEYILLKPTAKSDPLTWRTLEGEVSYPSGDSRKLITRTDLMPDIQYLNLVDPATAGGLGEGHDYSIEVMNATMQRAEANRNALGGYCNNLMLAKAVYGQLPARPPAPLETVIDASVKTGEDLSPVLEWTQMAAQRMLNQKKPIPEILHHRLGPRPPGTPQPQPTYDHWLDGLVDSVQQHISHIEGQRDHLSEQTMPPQAIFDSAFEQPESIGLGAKFNRVYTTALRQATKDQAEVRPEHRDAAREAAEVFLDRHSPQQQDAILRGAIVSAYIREKPGSDAAVWLAGGKAEQGNRLPGIAQRTIRSLREIGVLNEVADVEGGSGVIVYPGAATREPHYRTVGINGVWHNLYNSHAVGSNWALAEKAEDVPKEQRRWAKSQVSALAAAGENIPLEIREEEINGRKRKIAYDGEGRRFGTISRDSSERVGQSITVKFAVSHDGNLRVVLEDET
jgi:hypothetical protein